MNEDTKFILKQTSIACPEQYDVFFNDKQVGYLRLRWGFFYCSYPTHDGEVVYEAEPKGDGIFEDDERQFYIEQALQNIAKKLNVEKFRYEIWMNL